ncbi:MAG: hypothetical protein CVU05_08435 [Bacteroidetes bacterium HGW-Bacteroidetes-21]|jgi:hypothetical protein|nr:MAG: hypothetical protein CVU05_08435 [Bacteroidetes bacterium HGW-Bacteroidetes-21]
MRLIICLSVLLNFSVFLHAQDNNWQKDAENSGIIFYTNKAECHDIQNGTHVEYYLVQIHNTTDQQAEITWNTFLWSNETCLNCKEDRSDVKSFKVTIEAGETIEGDCSNKDIKGLHIFSRFLNMATKIPVTRFSFQNINVKFN